MDERIVKIKEKAIAFFTKKGKENWLWILGLCGILLIGVSSFWGGSENEPTSNTVMGNEDASVYATALEEQLETMLVTVQGVGNCRVMVTMEQATEYIYATQEKNTVDASQTSENSRFSTGSRTHDEETYIMVSTDNGQQPVLITALSPKVKGVAVVCEGGDDPMVCQAVRTTVATVLNINTNRICIVKGNNFEGK